MEPTSDVHLLMISQDTICNKIHHPLLSVNRTVSGQWTVQTFTVEEKVIGKRCVAKTEFLNVQEDNTFSPYFRIVICQISEENLV
jgi:hypothetical protein